MSEGKTRGQIENDICEILINHGPDGHTDGSDYITAYIMELLKANPIQPASKSDEEISDKEKVAIILNGWESEYELKVPSKELQQKILVASYVYTLEQQLAKQNQAVAELVAVLHAIDDVCKSDMGLRMPVIIELIRGGLKAFDESRKS